ncbi:MAG: peptidyl-prolyl cis-trans isomerase [Actinomycetota bacterium]|nr:peptidyl-prolyl cis-trans isomerase [Actinomycetota bacterium]
MTRTSHRLVTTLVTTGLAALLVSGCGNGPVRSGAAATVGDKRISTDELSGLVSRGLKDPQAQQQLGADKAKFQRDTLGRMIRHEILVATAKREHVNASPGAVDAKIADFEQQAGGSAALLQQAAQGGIAAGDLRPFITDLVLGDAIGDKVTEDLEVPDEQIKALYDQNAAQYDQVHAAHILVTSKALADSILEQVKADPSQFAPLAAKNSTDTSNKDKGGDLGFAGKGQFVKEFEAAVFGAKAGDFLEVKTQFGYHVVHVIDRKTTTLAQATPDLRRGALQKQRDQRVGELLSKVAGDLHVKVNPRFGRWDATQLSVVEASSKDAVTSPAPSPGEDQGDGTAPQQGQPGAPGAPQQGQPADPASPPAQ